MTSYETLPLPANLFEEMRRSYIDNAMAAIRGRGFQEPRFAKSISNGTISGTVCDADCSDSPGADSAPAAAADDDDGGDPDPEPARRLPAHTHPTAVAPLPAAPDRRTVAAMADESSHSRPRIDPAVELWPLSQVLIHIPVSRSVWYQGIKSGRFPAPVKLGQRRSAWRASEIRALVAGL